MSFSSRKNKAATAKDIVLSHDPSRRLLTLGVHLHPVHPPAYATDREDIRPVKSSAVTTPQNSIVGDSTQFQKK